MKNGQAANQGARNKFSAYARRHTGDKICIAKLIVASTRHIQSSMRTESHISEEAKARTHQNSNAQNKQQGHRTLNQQIRLVKSVITAAMGWDDYYILSAMGLRDSQLSNSTLGWSCFLAREDYMENAFRKSLARSPNPGKNPPQVRSFPWIYKNNCHSRAQKNPTSDCHSKDPTANHCKSQPVSPEPLHRARRRKQIPSKGRMLAKVKFERGAEPDLEEQVPGGRIRMHTSSSLFEPQPQKALKAARRSKQPRGGGTSEKTSSLRAQSGRGGSQV